MFRLRENSVRNPLAPPNMTGETGADQWVRPYAILLLLWLLWWRLGSGLVCGQIFARSHIGSVGHARDLATGGVVDADACVVEQVTHGAVQFHPRLFVSGHRRHQCGLCRG